ncbi:hypothetical protein NDN08_001938 [Rhodosorus marinus]|uniref:EGF-like domain-containing protein n=1 Tax=Rhodosorus marinus TaxID=101924 RepID=A0AAV8UV82_9RHOD|nr:hypothetical protein NDN08_001938 [Rhodosorus marinus]
MANGGIASLLLLAFCLLQACLGSSSVRDSARVWPTQWIYYQYDSSIDSDVRDAYEKAIDQYQNTTCLKFLQRSQDNRILLVSKLEACYDTKVGYKAGIREVSIHPRKNILNGKKNQRRFDENTWDQVDNQGVALDFSSVMQYGDKFLSKNGKRTYIPVPDSAPLQPRDSLSDGDIRTVNRLYNCPAYIPSRRFTLKLKSQRNLSGVLEVRVLMVDDQGKRRSKTQIVDFSVPNPRYKLHDFMFGVGRWQYFRVKVTDPKSEGKRPVIYEQLYPTELGDKYYRMCTSPMSCTRLLRFKTEATAEENSCRLVYCMNGGTCINRRSGYECQCARGFDGGHCEYNYGDLTVIVRSGVVPGNDPWYAGDSDPYVIVRAVRYIGNAPEIPSTSSKTIDNDNTPNWGSEQLQFGVGIYKEIEVTVKDSDGGLTLGDDTLFSTQTFKLYPPSETARDIRVYRPNGDGSFDYSKYVDLQILYDFA